MPATFRLALTFLFLLGLTIAPSTTLAVQYGETVGPDNLYNDNAYGVGFEDYEYDTDEYDYSYGTEYGYNLLEDDYEWWENSPYYSEEEWYDPTDWFDGNEYEYADDDYDGDQYYDSVYYNEYQEYAEDDPWLDGYDAYTPYGFDDRFDEDDWYYDYYDTSPYFYDWW